MSKHGKSYQAPTHAEISACAHLIYEREGRPEGKAEEHWLQAEAQLIAERKAAAGMAVAKSEPADKSRATTPANPPAQGASWSTPQRQSLRRN